MLQNFFRRKRNVTGSSKTSPKESVVENDIERAAEEKDRDSEFESPSTFRINSFREKFPNTTTAVFANSKGGVGKSTVAFMACLNLAIQEPNRFVEFIDLDKQATTSDSLKRFTNTTFKLVSDPEFLLASGGPNNARIYQYLNSSAERLETQNKRFVFFDTPAGTSPSEYSFMLDVNFLFVPTSSSDADLASTKNFLSKFFNRNPNAPEQHSSYLPRIIIVPNMLDNRDEIMDIYNYLREFPCFLGHPVFYSKIFRSTFGNGISDHNVVNLLRETSDFGEWVVNIFKNESMGETVPTSLFQI